MGVHGMLVFGNRDTYFSHIPMFHKPHDYQIVMEVKLNGDPVAGLGDQLHTFVPDAFSLGDLLNGKQKQLHGALYQGNFEGDGQVVRDHVTVEVGNVLRSQHLDPESPAPAELEYVLYGSRDDAYLVHPIHGGEASFDQLLSVEASGLQVSDQQLHDGLLVGIPGRPNSLQGRLRHPGESVTARSPEANSALELRVKRELSCLVGPHFTEGPPAGDSAAPPPGHAHH